MTKLIVLAVYAASFFTLSAFASTTVTCNAGVSYLNAEAPTTGQAKTSSAAFGTAIRLAIDDVSFYAIGDTQDGQSIHVAITQGDVVVTSLAQSGHDVLLNLHTPKGEIISTINCVDQ